MRPWRRRLAEARRSAQQGDWERAGTVYGAVGEEALTAGDRPTATQCFTQQGDALRRQDRPAAAARALRRALDLLLATDGAEDSQRAGMGAQLAGVLVDAGELQAASELARELLPRARGAMGRTLLLDTLSGALLAQGLVEDARGVIAELAATAPAGARVAVAFREAAVLRLEGRLLPADQQLASIQEALSDVPAAVGAWGAAVSERGELRLLQDRPEEAQEAFAHARDAWGAAGRRAGVFRAEAALVRTALARGATPLSSGLVAPIEYARDRGLPLLEAELRLALGQAGNPAAFDRGIALAQRAGARLLEGRLRLERLRSGLPSLDLARTRWCLAPDRPWTLRLEGELARGD